ncbi:uncharacterized protein LOC127149781 [Cucumis melo]|uniref:Uncharacterized protein LOC127149781 n=1 Tax=Cucumis melo TaxID=3656 RepID=A0ABM3KV63_CUCME|nr:uncharacterized protein LOC127149781 [Cucumis melo]
MAHKKMEDRLEGTEKEVQGLKEMMLELKKAVERMAEDMRESNTHRCKDESCTSDGSTLKRKGKMEDLETMMDNGIVTADRSKYKKLEMPMFVGENPESWVYCVEHFFGQDEVDWYKWSNNCTKVESWGDLKERMFEHFRDTGYRSLGARLIRIKQDGSYNDYVKKFVNYWTPLPDMAESVLMDATDAFVTVLEPTLQAEVLSRYPQMLEACMREA